MADEIDRACEREQADRDAAIAAARSAASTLLPACGLCYNCQSHVPPGLRYCDKPCADDHAARKSAEVRRGHNL
jgi:hypothetical protein